MTKEDRTRWVYSLIAGFLIGLLDQPFGYMLLTILAVVVFATVTIEVWDYRANRRHNGRG